jgi:hypothetical protein
MPLNDAKWAFTNMNRPGFGAHWLFVCDRVVGVMSTVVLGFGFGGWSAAESVHESGGVVPVHPVRGG